MSEAISVRDITGDWDGRTSGLAGATFFDSTGWLDAFAEKTGSVRRMGFFRGGRFVAALCFGVDEAPGLLRARVPFSASFGGLLMAAAPSLLCIDGAVRALLAALREEAGARALRIDYVQRPRHVSMHPQYDLEEFALLRNGFVVQDIQLEYFVETAGLVYSQTLRNELRRKRGLTFEPATMEEFLHFRDLVSRQQGKTKTLPDSELLRTEGLFGQRVRLYRARHEDRTVAMLLSDEVTQSCAIGRNWFQDADFAHLGATAFLVSEWIAEMDRRGFARAGFGASARLTRELIPGFLFFKERFRPCTATRRTFALELSASGGDAGEAQ